MDLKRLFRILALVLLAGLLVIGLAGCRLPASTGPQSSETAKAGFPVPGETKPAPTQIDLSVFATQTSQAKPAESVATQESPQNPVQNTPYPIATTAPAIPTGPTSTPLTYIEATPGGPPATYTLQQGEYPFCIARRFDVSQAELLALNNLTVNSLVSPGTELKIPQTGDPFDGERVLHDHPTTYKIEAGDTLYRIACYFGDLSPDLIAEQNHLSSWDLPVGEVLIIP